MRRTISKHQHGDDNDAKIITDFEAAIIEMFQ